jgi:Membrane bound beta barrel domain (DUF5777)
MKLCIHTSKKWLILPGCFLLCFQLLTGIMQAQDSTIVAEEAVEPAKVKPVKNTFNGIWIIDNQTVMVPIKGTFEMDIMHRFGTVKNGYEDFWGFFAPSNIRLGFDYVPINNLMVGLSITKANMTWEVYGKYAILKQTPGKYPVSVTYFGDVAFDSRKKEHFVHFSDRLMYFNQLIIARKITEKISLQVAPSHTHINVVNGYFYEPGKYRGTMSHEHFAVALSGRYKLKENMAIIVNYDQPITKHISNNPAPNVSFGLELSTSSHAFQFFLGNYNAITPQRNNYFNQNDPRFIGQYLIGFNITRLWNY